MPHAALSPTVLAIGLLALSATCALAQSQPEEQDRAVVHRHAPAQAVFSEAIARRLRVDDGFHVEVWASGLGHPRMIEVGADGTAYVTRRDEGDVIALRDADGDGRADQRSTVATGLQDVNCWWRRRRPSGRRQTGGADLRAA